MIVIKSSHENYKVNGSYKGLRLSKAEVEVILLSANLHSNVLLNELESEGIIIV